MDGDFLERPFPAYDGEEPYIFISYAHKDAKLVFPEIKRFHDEGYPIWYDQGLTPGQEWDDEIAMALMNCSLLVVFISKNSMASENVQDEVKLAINRRIDITPIYLEETALPPGLELRLSNRHAIFKDSLSDSDYIQDCLKAFNKAKIPKNEIKKVKKISKTMGGPFPAYEGDENYIFVSYAYKDAELVFPDIKRFHDKGYPIWYDECLTEGQEGNEKIEKFLLNSSLLLVFISENSIASENVRNEVNLAINNKIDITPIYLEETVLPPGLELRLSNKHAILKHELNDNVYIRDCFKAFNKYKISNITEKSIIMDDRLTSEYLREFDRLNTTTKSIYDLEDNDVLIILKDGTNLTDWDDLRNKRDVIYISENLSNHTDLSGKYKDFKSLKSLVALEISGKVTKLDSMFDGCNKLVDLSALKDWDVSNITSMASMFKDCGNLVDLSALKDWNVSNVTTMDEMFSACRSLVDLSALKDWDVSNVGDMHSMFEMCIRLNNLSALKNWNVSNVENMGGMFSDCGLQELSALKDWDVSNVNDMAEIFKGCSGLLDLFHLKDWDVSNVDNMRSMFEGCFRLDNLFALKNWDVSKVTNMDSIFRSCEGLVDLFALKDWDVSNVTTMESMFRDCRDLVDLFYLKDWDVSNVTTMRGMFSACRGLVELPALKDWDVSNVDNMRSMFYGCFNLADLSALKDWDVSNVTTMWSMFTYCGSLVDLSALKDWDVSNVTTMWSMFTNCGSLVDLSVLNDWDVSGETNISSIFEGCKSLEKYPKWYEH